MDEISLYLPFGMTVYVIVIVFNVLCYLNNDSQYLSLANICQREQCGTESDRKKTQQNQVKMKINRNTSNTKTAITKRAKLTLTVLHAYILYQKPNRAIMDDITLRIDYCQMKKTIRKMKKEQNTHRRE